MTITSVNKTNKAEFSSIYAVSFTDDAGTPTAPIAGLILDNLKFNDTRVIYNTKNPAIFPAAPLNRLVLTVAVNLTNSLGVTVTNSDITNTAQSLASAADCAISTGNTDDSTLAQGMNINSSKNIFIMNNKFHNMQNSLNVISTPILLTNPIYVNSTNGVTIKDNEFVHMSGNGIQIAGVSTLVISGNLFHDFDTIANQPLHPDNIQFDPSPVTIKNLDGSITVTTQLPRHDHVIIKDNLMIKSNHGIGEQGIFCKLQL